MKRLTAILCACGAMYFIACNSNKSGGDATSDTTQAATDTTKMQAAPVNTIVTTPQNMVIIMHKVKDFAKWMPFYEADDSNRVAAGLHNYVVARGVQDSNMVLVALLADDVDKAHAFGSSPKLKQVMQKSGVVGAPTVEFNTAIFRDTSKVDIKVRATISFAVKDFATWQHGFDSTKQIRIDNGFVDRVVSHDVKDDKKIRIAFALTDTAKANAFYKSQQLKDIMAHDGVIGKPNTFMYTIVKRY